MARGSRFTSWRYSMRGPKRWTMLSMRAIASHRPSVDRASVTIVLSKRRLEFIEEQARSQGFHEVSIEEIAAMCRELLDLRRINHVEVLTPSEFARRLKLPAKTILELCRRA